MKKKKKNTAKNLNKGLIAFLVMAVIALNFSLIGSVLADDSNELDQNLALPLPVKTNFDELAPETSEVTITNTLAVCDHNGDGLRNLSDVSMLAEIKDTLSLSEIAEYAQNNQDDIWCAAKFRRLPVCDHNGDTLRNLSDVALFAEIKDSLNLTEIADYAEHNQDDIWCAANYGPRDLESAQGTQEVDANVGLAICDHNGDGLRNLSDVPLLAACQNTFDANGDGVHDLSDISLYASMNQDANFCHKTFVCVATSTPAVELIIETPVISNNGGSSSNGVGLAICDHNGDNVRNLSDVALFAEIKDSLNLSQIAEYAQNNQNDDWCSANYGQQNPEIVPEVLGEKLSTCNIDNDVAGRTEWAEGSLIRGCDMKVYRIENQTKRHILSLKDLFKYIGERIYNVTDDIVALF